MANISPSPDSVPSTVPPQPLTPPPQPSTPPPTPSTPAEEPNANTSDPPNQSPPPPPPPTPPNAPPPTNSGTPPVTTPPVDPSPPPNSNAQPPSPPVSPPPTQESPPPLPPSVSPPPPTKTVPPVSSPPPVPSPPPVSPPNPPTSAPPPPPVVTPPTSAPPPSSNPPPPTPSTPTPPSSEPPRQSPPPPPPPPSSDPPVQSPPPPSSQPPKKPPPPPASDPPRRSPPPPKSEPPQSPPSPPATEPPSSASSPPPSGPRSVPPPSVTPSTPPPALLSPPPSGSKPATPSSPSSLVTNSTSNASETAKVAGKGGIGSGGVAAIGIVAGVLILGLVGLVAFWMFKRKKRKSGTNGGHVIPASIGSSPRSDGNLLVKTEFPGGGSGTDTPTDHGGFGHSRSWFTYQDLLEATGGFSDENLLGEGGFGYVYKGILADGRVVAVKQLKIGGQQGEREFKAEVEIISRIHHRHLVSLVGYCIWDSRRLLVYDFVPNDTLHFHLHGGGSALDWATRVKIAAGAARGLAYLHEDCHPRIIHRDIKSSNILLDNNFDAQVSDFGLAKLALDADTHVSTRVMGTFGYLAPEYATTGKLTEKSDVYSFGVVLLELVTGRKPVDESQPLGDESLVEWARPRLTHALDTGDYEGLVDPQLGKNFIEGEMFRMIEAAAACVRHSAAKRPRMGQVVRALDGISDSGDLSNGLRVGESQLYDSAQQSAEIRWFRRMAFGGQDISTDFFSSQSQNIGRSTYSGPNVVNNAADILRQQGQNTRNTGFSGQSQQNVGFSGQPRQHSLHRPQSSQSSQNVDSSNQGNRTTGIFREDSLNR